MRSHISLSLLFTAYNSNKEDYEENKHLCHEIVWAILLVITSWSTVYLKKTHLDEIGSGRKEIAFKLS